MNRRTVLLLEATFSPEGIATLPELLDVLAGYDDIIVFTSRACEAQLPAAAVRANVEVRSFDHYFSNPQVELAALQLCAERSISCVIAMREFDLVRAARIREAAGLPGMSCAVVEVYRDKLRMKERARARGIDTPRFMGTDTVTEIWRAAATFGFPFIVKPRRKAAGLGFTVLRSVEDLHGLCCKLAPTLDVDQPLDLIAEEYFGNRNMFHLDGVWRDRDFERFFASEYIGLRQHFPGLKPGVDDLPLAGSLNLPTQDPMWQPLQAFARKVIEALGSQDSFAFHVEVWEQGGDLSLNEAACRTGGGQVYELLTQLFAENADLPGLRACLGIASAGLQASVSQYTLMARVPRKEGIFKGITPPASPSLSWHLYCAPGDAVLPQANWLDRIGYVLSRADNRSSAEAAAKQACAEIHACIG